MRICVFLGGHSFMATMASESSLKNWTDEERLKLAESLDNELDDFIESLPKKPYTEGFSPHNLEQEMEEHPLFMSNSPKEGEEMPPLVEALQKLKYDPDANSPDELAQNYKTDGNYNFKLKKYRWAIESYTAGLKINCPSQEINTQLYTNRAAANYYLGNFKSSLNDCNEALKINENHQKAIIRAAQCCQHLKKFDEAQRFCDRGLQQDSECKILLDLKPTSQKLKKEHERDLRKGASKQKKVKQKEDNLIEAITKRGIKVYKRPSESLYQALEPFHSAAAGAKVHLLDDCSLVWPVLFIYPEHEQTDIIQNFNENDSFMDHFQVMFNSAVEWDTDGKYLPENLKIYFAEEENDSNNLYECQPEDTLKKILSCSHYLVREGTPSFFVTVDNSPFNDQFIQKYKYHNRM